MAEVLGAIASGITVASLVKICLEAFDLIQIGRKQSLDYEKLALRLNIERARLYTWGQAMGFAPGSGGSRTADRLEGSPFENLVRDTLCIIVRLFFEGDKLRTKYGCAISRDQPKDNQAAVAKGRSSNAIENLAASFAQFRLSNTESSSVGGKIASKTKWVIQDRPKFQDLIDEIRDLINGLLEITTSISTISQQERIVRSNIQKIKDHDTLSLLSEVCQRDHADLSDAASTRIEILSLGTNQRYDISQWAATIDKAKAGAENNVANASDITMGDINTDIADLEELTVTELKNLVYQLREKVRSQPERLNATSTLPVKDQLQGFMKHSLTPPQLPILDEESRILLEHFQNNVVHLIFPIFEMGAPGVAWSKIILPTLATHKCYLHHCLSIAAIQQNSMHTLGEEDKELTSKILAHRFTAISEICKILDSNADPTESLTMTLGFTFFEQAVGRMDNDLPSIPWHQHFHAVTSIMGQLKLPELAEQPAERFLLPERTTFDVALTAWIDILGSSMLGEAPQFASLYRHKNLSKGEVGLRVLMGCEDHTMYLISEIACLDALKLLGHITNIQLCAQIGLLDREISAVKLPYQELKPDLDARSGFVPPKQLTYCITALFQCAAHMWLYSLASEPINTLQPRDTLQLWFMHILSFVKSGPEGFDRTIVWPLLVAGALSTPNDPFRVEFAKRVELMNDVQASTGSFGRLRCVLNACWERQAQFGPVATSNRNIWRDVMQIYGWDYLLI